jgi:cytochrome c oxidase cbb3-type subunit III
MSAQKSEKLLSHNYDGIEEYDNPMPRWWVWIFIITILFSVVYFVYYHMLGGPSHADEYEAEMKIWGDRIAELAPAVTVTEASLMALLDNQAGLAEGKAKFEQVCAACHTADGGGLIGPNLCDNYWIHGQGSMLDIHKTVSEGVLEKGMLAWKNQLDPDLLNNVVAYAYTLKGNTPANPKAPEGNPVQE